MREPVIARPEDLDQIPDRSAVFLLRASEGKPYLAKTALLRRRLKRLISDRDRISRVLNLRGVADTIEYWLTGSQLESTLIHLELAKTHFPEDWPRITRLRPPVFLRLTLDNLFPRTMITTRLTSGFSHGPFASRAAAERFEGEVLDLFQVRRCEENLAPSPDHPGCIYGEMNRCLRPCQQAVSAEEYRAEATRLEQFLRTGGSSLKESTEAARDSMSADMQFEEAARLHQRLTRISEVQALSGELARSLDRLNGIAITPSAEPGTVELWFMTWGEWQPPRRVDLSESVGVGISLDHRLRELAAGVAHEGKPNPDHIAILSRWHGSSWRDGEWIGFDESAKLPYRRLVNAIGRVAKPAHAGAQS